MTENRSEILKGLGIAFLGIIFSFAFTGFAYWGANTLSTYVYAQQPTVGPSNLTSNNVALNEVQKLKAQVIVLRSQLLQCQATAENSSLTLERAKLESEFRRSLGAKDEEVFDWSTFTFKSSNQSKSN